MPTRRYTTKNERVPRARGQRSCHLVMRLLLNQFKENQEDCRAGSNSVGFISITEGKEQNPYTWRHIFDGEIWSLLVTNVPRTVFFAVVILNCRIQNEHWVIWIPFVMSFFAREIRAIAIVLLINTDSMKKTPSIELRIQLVARITRLSGTPRSCALERVIFRHGTYLNFKGFVLFFLVAEKNIFEFWNFWVEYRTEMWFGIKPTGFLVFSSV